MKLYSTPKNTYVRVLDEESPSPPYSLEINKDIIFLFKHIDGMFSLCYDLSGNICHMFAGTEVEIVSAEDVAKFKVNNENTI